jgi:hypothetical protein
MSAESIRKLLYGGSMAVIAYGSWQAVVRPALAAWPNGCCTYSSHCGGAMICCEPPSGWAACSESYANYCSNSCPPGC